MSCTMMSITDIKADFTVINPSICLTVTSIHQLCLHQLEWSLLEMKTASFGNMEYIFKSQHVQSFIDMSVQRHRCKLKQPLTAKKVLLSWCASDC